MQSSWASSLDLHLALTPGRGRRAALERALRDAIRAGRLRPGERLPSTRALAHDLGLARNTVADAYAQLAAEGYLRARPGAATRVAPVSEAAPPGAPHADVAPPRHDLRVGIPDTSAFPRAAWLKALRRALATAPAEALARDDPRGRPELRAALAGYLGRARGVLADPDRIVVTSGFTQGFAMLCHALEGTVAMEDPCLHHLRAIARDAGLTVAALPVDEHGAQVPDGAAAALVTPAHQFPLGATLAPARRSALVAWGGLVIEDDYDGEFRYDRQPVGALQGLDPDRVVYAGTASKTLAPALRVGWLVLPERLLEPVLAARPLAGGATAALEQLALAELIASGAFDRHVRRMRQRYRRRRDALLAVLDGRPTRGIAAGLHLVLDLDGGEDEIVGEAARRGLALDGLSRYWHDGGAAGLVLGYAAAAEHAYPGTLATLAGVLRTSSPR